MRLIDKLSIAYFQKPHRDQDVIRVKEYGENVYAVSVVDGFTFKDKIPGDAVGRRAAAFIADCFPDYFMATTGRGYKRKGEKAALGFDKVFLKEFPQYVSAACAFLFHLPDKDVIVSIGTINVWIWDGAGWVKPPEVGDYFLPYPQYASGSKTFFGHGQLKHGNFYSAKPDVVILPHGAPIIIATDGLDYVMKVKDLNALIPTTKPRTVLTRVENEVLKLKNQKDDISFLIRA